MLANFLNKSKPINFIGLLVFFVLAFFYAVFFDMYAPEKLLKSSVVLLLFLTSFFIFNFINTKNKLTLDNSFAFYTFTLIIVSLINALQDYNILFTTILYFLFLRKTYSLRSPKKTLEKLFDSGFWLGILFILEPFSILFFILIYAASYLHSKINIHTVFTPIVGFITPLILFFTYHFWCDTSQIFEELFNFRADFSLEFYYNTKYVWVFFGVIFFSVLAMFFKSMKTLSVNNTFRKSWILVMVNFATALIFLTSFVDKDGSELIFLVFPASIILANGIEIINKKTLKNLVLYLFLAASIIIHFFL